MDTSAQIILFRDKFSPFYKRNQIKVVTEQQVKMGVENIGFNELPKNQNETNEYTKMDFQNYNKEDSIVKLNNKDPGTV